MSSKFFQKKNATPFLKPIHPAKNSDENWLNSAGYNLLLLDKISALINKLQQSRIQVMALKGMALIENIYEDISQRTMEDGDILVKPEQLHKAREIIKEAGFKLIGTNQANSEAYEIEPSYKIFLDLHWRLVNQYSPSQKLVYLPDERLIWKRAIKIKLRQQTALAMCYEDLLVYLCFHALKERFSQKKWLKDIFLLIKSHKEEINWNKFLEIAEECGTDKLCAFILEYQIRKFGIDIPSFVLSQIKEKYKFYSCEENLFRLFTKGSDFLKNMLWPLAMNSSKKQMSFFKKLPVYLWKKMTKSVFIGYKYT